MAVSRGIGKIVWAILGILIIVGAAALIIKLFAGEAPLKPMMLNAIELRKSTDAVKKAQIISQLDDDVATLANERIIEQWDAITDCLSKRCSDDMFMEFVLMLALEYQEQIPRSDLIINLIATARYWGTESVVEFSRAMTLVDQGLQQLKSRAVEKKWGEIVTCNGTCPEKNNLYFDLIALVLQE